VLVDDSQLRALLVGADSAVRSVQCKGISRARDVPAGGQERESSWKIWQQSDGRYRIERAEGDVYFDGTTCWVVSPDGAQAVKSPVPLPSVLKNAISPGWLGPRVALTDLGEGVFGGRPCRHVDARTPDGELHYSLTVDQETGLILKSRDERTGIEFELHDVLVNGEIDEARFRPDLDPGVTTIEPPRGFLAALRGRSQARRARSSGH
jgi:outer membrane lipoprotein-sorting protein